MITLVDHITSGFTFGVGLFSVLALARLLVGDYLADGEHLLSSLAWRSQWLTAVVAGAIPSGMR